MKKLLVLFCLFISLSVWSQSTLSSGSFVAGNNSFLLNGKPFVLRAGELHFPRIPKEYWEHRIEMCKAMGMNAICIYLFWNYHELQPGVFDFTGQKDVAAFVKLAQKHGMYCIVRPGPYACAEWDLGGLPWWLLKKQDIQMRTGVDSYFMERAKLYLNEVGKQLAPLQIQNGGNIIMVQVENEYATYGKEQPYMEAIRDAVRTAGFDKVQLFRCDWSSNFNNYKLDGVATTLNFGAGSNIDNQFKSFKELYPTAPLMCSEYWSGWFDHWGKPHETRSINSFIGSFKDMMDKNISVSLYMAHGGTSFGQWGGANGGPYSAMATSYDYNAPIDEQGSPTEKFYALRDLLKNYLQPGETLPEMPTAKPIITIPSFQLAQTAGFFNNLPTPKTSVDIQPMEMFDQGWGRILYRNTIPASANKRKLLIKEVHDWALVFIDGKQIGKLDRRMGDTAIELPPINKAARLDILVEATGRVNYRYLVDRKGITEEVKLIDANNRTVLKNWQVYNFPTENGVPKYLKFTTAKADGPAWYKGSFTLNKTGDAYLNMSNWGKGMVWVNGYNIGRFWKIGPQQTLFMPGCWLRKGTNEVVVLDLETPTTASIEGVAKPILDIIHPDESLLHRAKGQTLNLSSETPVHTASFTAGGGWKEVNFSQKVQGRFLCIEALSSQKDNDPLSSIAEIEVLGEDGLPLSKLLWKIAYADSEEVTAANNAADKIFDLQESTYWQSESAAKKPKHPHQVVIDLGKDETIKGMKYLPRGDKNASGLIKDYRIFVKTNAFIY